MNPEDNTEEVVETKPEKSGNWFTGTLRWVYDRFTRVYTNVLLLIWLVVGAYATFAAAFYAAGIGAINIPMSGVVAGGILAIGGDLAKRSLPFKGKFSPFNVNVLGTFLGGFAVLSAAVTFGLAPLIESVEGSVLALVGALILSLFNAMFGLALGSLSSFTSRDMESNPIEK